MNTDVRNIFIQLKLIKDNNGRYSSEEKFIKLNSVQFLRYE